MITAVSYGNCLFQRDSERQSNHAALWAWLSGPLRCVTYRGPSRQSEVGPEQVHTVW